MEQKEENGSRRTKDWSVMVYLAGDNNLSEEMVWALQEMNEYFWKNRNDLNLKLAVQFDALGAYPRRYRFPNVNGSPSVLGPDGELREFNRTGTPLAMTQGTAAIDEDVLLDTDLHAVELESIARETLLKEGQNPSNPTLISSFAGLEGSITSASSVGGSSLAERLSKVAKYMLESTSSFAQLQHLAKETVEEHEPVAYRAVILSGHGNGGFGDFLPDSDPGSALSIPDIKTFLELLRADLHPVTGLLGSNPQNENLDLSNSPKIDLLGMDACLMSTLEVCYEVRKQAKYIVGAEGFVPMAGWPYQRVLSCFQDNVELTAREIVQRYYRYYRDYEDACTSTDISAIDLTKICAVSQSLKALVGLLGCFLKSLAGSTECLHLMQDLHSSSCEELSPPPAFGFSEQPLDELVELGRYPLPVPPEYAPDDARTVRNALVLARWYAQSYQWENQVDLWDFCDQLHRFLPHGAPFSEIHEACEAVKDAVDEAVLLNGWTGADFQHSHGLSVYFPVSAADFAPEYYGSDSRNPKLGDVAVSFARDSGWGCFLRAFLGLTRRVRRNQEDYMKPADLFRSFRRQGMQNDNLAINAFSNLQVRSSSPFNTRSSSPFNTRSSSPFNTRSSSPFNTKSSLPNLNNAPDGYYPTPPTDAEIGVTKPRWMDEIE